MKSLLIGALIGYGLSYFTNTPQGRGMIKSTRTAVGKLDDKLTKIITPEEVEVKKEEPLQIKSNDM